jgi:hypothetical protein
MGVNRIRPCRMFLRYCTLNFMENVKIFIPNWLMQTWRPPPRRSFWHQSRVALSIPATTAPTTSRRRGVRHANTPGLDDFATHMLLTFLRFILSVSTYPIFIITNPESNTSSLFYYRFSTVFLLDAEPNSPCVVRIHMHTTSTVKHFICFLPLARKEFYIVNP